MANLSGGDLRKLFYAFFSFLNRRTDFYCVLPSDGSNGGGRMGFKEGQAEQILLASFRQFPLRKVGPKPNSGGAPAKPAATAVPASKPASMKKEAHTEASPKPDKEAVAPVKYTNRKGKDDASAVDSSSTSKSANTKKVEAKDTIRYTEEGKQIPIGNGGSTSRYVWTQTLEEVTVHIPLPEGIRGKDLSVKIVADSLSICQKNGTVSHPALDPIEGTLFARIRPSESTWTLESSTHSSQTVTTLQLILDKVQKTWWAAVLSGDAPLIDTTMVDSTRHISTYDDQTQSGIRRIMFDQRQERLGLKTSQQMMSEDLPPLPTGEKVNLERLPAGVEYIDGETLDKASITNKS